MTSKYEHNTPQPLQALRDALERGAMNERVEARILTRAKAQLDAATEDRSPVPSGDRTCDAAVKRGSGAQVWRALPSAAYVIVVVAGMAFGIINNILPAIVAGIMVLELTLSYRPTNCVSFRARANDLLPLHRGKRPPVD